MAGIEIVRTFDLSHVDLVTAEDMREIGLLAREQILRRTMSGRDVDGQTFPAYSPRYAAQKRQALGGGDVVNLQVSGAMLNDLTVVDVAADGEQASVTLGWVK